MTPRVRQVHKKGRWVFYLLIPRSVRRQQRIRDFYPALIFDASKSPFVP